MLKPDLTLEKALAELNQPETILKWELTPETPFVSIYKESRQLLDEIFEKRLAVDRGFATNGATGGI